MVKQYITWTDLWKDNFWKTNFDIQLKKLWSKVVSVEKLEYNGTNNDDARKIAIIEFDDSMSDNAKTRFINNFSGWCFFKITPQDAVDLCNEWYPAPEGEDDYFSLDADGFTIVDRR